MTKLEKKVESGNKVAGNEVSIREFASEKYVVIETTVGMNGYPCAVLPALIGFETFDEAKQFAFENDLELMWVEKKDGWNLWERVEEATEPITIKEDDFGNTCIFERSAEDCFEQMKEVIDSCDDLDEVKTSIARFEPIIEACENRADDEVVVTINGDYYDTLPERVISFYYDTWTTELAAIKF